MVINRQPSSKKAKRIEIAEDMLTLLNFGNDKNIHRLSEFTNLQRVFEEHCDFHNNKLCIKTKTKPDSLQNPSDPDAAYSGHKGTGYQVQLAETYDEQNEVQLVTLALPQTANERDPYALPTIMKQLNGNKIKPELLLADSSYGSDQNINICTEYSTRLLSPVNGSYKTRLKVNDFKINANNVVESCPEGHISDKAHYNHEKGFGRASWDMKICKNCSSLSICPVLLQRNRYVLLYDKKRLALARRREYQNSPEFKNEYRKRSGIESVFRRLDLLTGLKHLRVREKNLCSCQLS